jgi:hypothetical protein
MFSLRTHAIIFGALLALVIGIAVLGNVLEGAGMAPPAPALRWVILGGYLALVLALALSAIPVMVKAVLAAQVTAGNGELPLVKFLNTNQTWIILAMWALMIVGIAIAIPAAINDGAFEEAPSTPTGPP